MTRPLPVVPAVDCGMCIFSFSKRLEELKADNEQVESKSKYDFMKRLEAGQSESFLHVCFHSAYRASP